MSERDSAQIVLLFISFSMITSQDTIENKWLGHSKVLLFGKPVDPERIASLDKKIGGLTRKYFSTDPDFGKSGRRKLLERLLDASAHLTKRQVDKGLEAVFSDSEAERPFGTFVKDFETCAASLKTVISYLGDLS